MRLVRKGSVNELSKNSLYHNQPHKYLDFNIDLSELRQILCKTEFPTRFKKLSECLSKDRH
ncbi:hypothetical protein B1J94_06300 [Leptospira kirschneri serovar Grippotyphosa]|nr:hypothetical protein B1J94_06300 [Leptospira kirschneri serovar Grippotyphosa]